MGQLNLASVTHREIARGAEVDQRISILAPSFWPAGFLLRRVAGTLNLAGGCRKGDAQQWLNRLGLWSGIFRFGGFRRASAPDRHGR